MSWTLCTRWGLCTIIREMGASLGEVGKFSDRLRFCDSCGFEHQHLVQDYKCRLCSASNESAVVGTVTPSAGRWDGVSVYKPVPPPKPLPAYRMPPALPGSAPDAPLHTHSNKFPIEREVILSTSDKNSKIPVLNEVKKRGKLGVAIAPDAPPKQLAAWTRDSMVNPQNPTAGTSNEANFRQQYNDQTYAPYNMQNAGGAIPRNIQGHDNAHGSPKSVIPGKNPALYALRPDMKNDGSIHNNSQSITVTVETGKDNTKDAPKSSSKSVTKTYHTLKDMISSRFKGKDSHDSDKAHENETDLNNVADELRKSTRERTEPDSRSMTPRENNNRKTGEQHIYGRPMPQQRNLAEMQYNQHLLQHMHHTSLQGNNSIQNHMQSHAPFQQQQSQPHQQMLTVQQQLLQQQLNQQMMINQHVLGHTPNAASTPQHSMMQARSQEMLARPQSQLLADSPQRPQSQLVNQMVTADSIYYHPQYGNMARNTNRSAFQRDGEIPNFTSLKQTAGAQMESSRMKPELRSPQQLEREILRQRSLAESRRAASQPQLPLDEPPRDEQGHEHTAHSHPNKAAAARRGSHGNLLETMGGEGARVARNLNAELEKDSDDGGFRSRHMRDGSCRVAKNESHLSKPDVGAESAKPTEGGENVSQKSADGGYGGKAEGGYGAPPQAASRHTPNRLEELKNNSYHNKKMPGSAASSDYDKNGGQSSNVDSGRGSVAYSSGRRPEGTSMHDTSADSDALGLPTTGIEPQNPAGNKAVVSNPGESEWVDIVESELRQILEPKLHNLSINNGVHSTMSESVSSVTPPLPPLSPSGSTPNVTPRTSTRYKHQSLPAGSRAEYSGETQQRQRSPGPGAAGSRAPWPHHAHKHRSSSKRDHHTSSSQYKKHVFGLDTTDITSTTTRSLDLSSMLDGQSESDASTADARAIRRQLHGLETMYSEVLKLLGVRKPSNHSLGKYQPSDPRLAKRRYGSMSSLPSSSVSSRPVRDKRRSMTEHRKKVNDMKSINKRFQRLESHVVTLARSVAHLSSEMRTQHLMMQEMENIRSDISALRSMHRSQSLHRMTNGFACAASGGVTEFDPLSFTNPHRVKKLTKFFGDEPPLMRLFLKRLGYEKYAPLLEAERVGAAELPYVGEDRLRALGVPLGPRLRILREAGAQTELPPMPTRDAAGNTTTTLCIV